MLENFMSMFRKRRRTDGDDTRSSSNSFYDSLFSSQSNPTTATGRESPFNDDNNGNTSSAAAANAQFFHINPQGGDRQIPPTSAQATKSVRVKLDSERVSVFDIEQAAQFTSCHLPPNTTHREHIENTYHHLNGATVGEAFPARTPYEDPASRTHGLIIDTLEEDMEIDSSTVPPPQEYSDRPNPQACESSMNFDYLHNLDENATDVTMDSTSRRFANIGGSANPEEADACSSVALVDDSKAIDRPINIAERFLTVLDELDTRVERFRKDALGLQEKRDFLLMSVDLIRSNEGLQSMSEAEQEEIHCYIQRVNSRLATVELNVRTVRDRAQEDSLSQINALIDMMITLGDPVLSRQRCQQYLNSCSNSGFGNHMLNFPESTLDIDFGPVDKKFESVLLGCTLDDQKKIKRRLQALMDYLNRQTVRN